MSRSIVVFVALTAVGTARAEDHHAVFGVYIGVPIPLVVYGFDPNLEGSGASVDLLIQSRLSYGLRVAESIDLYVGVMADFSVAGASDSEVEARGHQIAVGPELSVRLPLTTQWSMGAAAGPAYILGGFKIDENLKQTTHALGVQGHVWGGWSLLPWLGLCFDVGLIHSFEPFGAPTFFNKSLLHSTAMELSVGVLFLH